MTPQLVKHFQIGSYWRIVIAIPLVLLLIAGTIVGKNKFCSPEPTPDKFFSSQPVERWRVWVVQLWHCIHFTEFVTEKAPSAIERLIKGPPALSERHVIRR
jgi:hypothetical protein